ncbi:MAG: CHAT domain-containing protein, partial [Pseudomonadota bacterium]
LSILHLARQKQAARGAPSVFGEPVADGVETRSVAEVVARSMGCKPVFGQDVTRAAVIRAIRSGPVHFQGHAVQVASDPLQSHLELTDGTRLTALEIMELSDVAAPLVSLGACESAAAVLRGGDEPLGLVPALLQAGVGAVVASLWRVQDRDAGIIMAEFHDLLAQQVSPIEALQRAALAHRGRCAAPYHWAPFTLHGDPWTTIGRRLERDFDDRESAP